MKTSLRYSMYSVYNVSTFFQANERHMRTLAVEPPPMLDKEERRVKFINRNGNLVKCLLMFGMKFCCGPRTMYSIQLMILNLFFFL